MDYHTLPASKPGQPPVRVEKRTLDNKFFQIDLTPILASKEGVYGTANIVAPPGNIVVESAVARQQKFLLIKLSGGPTNIPYEDVQLQFQVNTTSGNLISVPVLVRAYST